MSKKKKNVKDVQECEKMKKCQKKTHRCTPRGTCVRVCVQLENWVSENGLVHSQRQKRKT